MILKDKKISFIGGGNMASALISGLLAKGINPSHITVADPSADVRARHAKHKINTIDPITNASADNSTKAVAQADIVVLAVKPQVMKEVVANFVTALNNQLVISVAAGLTTDTLSNFLGGHSNIVRAMPNTPAMIQMGATGLYANDRVSETARQAAEALMRLVGLAVWVDAEAKLHAVTAVSGSAPAYFFYVFEAMIEAGQTLGLSKKEAAALVMQTAMGSAQLAITSDDEPSELRHKVTSPNGTTQAAIDSLQHAEMPAIFARAMQACVARSEQISDELKV